MTRNHRLRTFRVTTLVVAALSIAVGLLVATLTGHYIAVFVAQLMVAGVLAGWYSRIKRRPTATE